MTHCRDASQVTCKDWIEQVRAILKGSRIVEVFEALSRDGDDDDGLTEAVVEGVCGNHTSP